MSLRSGATLPTLMVGATAVRRAYRGASLAHDPGYDLILLIGQSNMSGRGTPTNTTLDPTDPRILQDGSAGAGSRTIALATDPLLMHDTPSGLSCGSTFGRRYLPSLVAERKVLLVPAAHGSTSLISTATLGWNPNSAGNLLDQAISQTQDALTAAGPNSRLAGVLWHQGESDQGETGYAALLDQLIAKIRTAFSLPDLLFIIGQLRPDRIVAGGGLDIVNQQHLDTPRRVQRTGFAYGHLGFSQSDASDPHYNGAGARLLGQAMYDEFLRAAANVTGTAPLAPPTVGATATDNTATVTWTRPASRLTGHVVQFRTSASGPAGPWTTVTRSATLLDTVQTITGLTASTAYDVRVQNANETGSSAYTTSTVTTSAAPASPPGQVTGLTNTASNTSSVTDSWTATPTATSYLVEYRVTGAGSWTTFGTVTATTAMITSLTAGTSYDRRVSATNGAGTGTPSATLTSSTTTVALLLDGMTASARRAYSTGKVRSAYAGQCLRVRRSSDNTESDIGFTGNDLNTTALLAFAGAGDAFVTRWYDQSGNALDVAQTTAASQPRIVLAGVVDTRGGKPALVFDGTDDYLTASTVGMYAAGATSVLGVASRNGAPTGDVRLITEASSTANTQYYSVANTFSAGTPASDIRTDGSVVLLAGRPTAPPAVTDLTPHQLAFVDSGTAWRGEVDGSASASSSYTRSGTLTLNLLTVGALRRLSAHNYSNAAISEVVTFLSVLSSGDLVAARSSAIARYGTP